MHLGVRRSSCRSASSASTLNPMRTTYRFCARSKAEASNDDGDELDNGMAVYATGVPAHSLAYRRMTGEMQEMSD